MKHEYDSETWTGRPGEEAVIKIKMSDFPKLDAVTTWAWLILAASLAGWVGLAVTQTDAFGANVVTEFLGVTAEIAAVILGLDWIIQHRQKARNRQAIETAAARVVGTVSMITSDAVRVHNALADAVLEFGGAPAELEVRPSIKLQERLKTKAGEADTLFDRHAIALALEPDLHELLRRAADYCDDAAANIGIALGMRNVPWDAIPRGPIAKTQREQLKRLTNTFTAMRDHASRMDQRNLGPNFDVLLALMEGVSAHIDLELERINLDFEPPAQPAPPED